MTTKRIPIGTRPASDPTIESWVRQGNGAEPSTTVARPNLYTARLTIDVTPELRARIKVRAFRRGVTVADMVRALLQREFAQDKEEGT